MQEISVCASILLSSLLVSKVCPLPVAPFTSCGCIEQSDTVSLTDTRQVSLLVSQCHGACRQLGAQLFAFDNQGGSCLCGNTTKTLLCEELEEDDYSSSNPLLEVFCTHPKEDHIPPLTLSSVLHVASVPGEKMRTLENVTSQHVGGEDDKEDTWVLAIILGCFCILCLIVGGMRAAYQNRKEKRKEQYVRNIQESWISIKKSPNIEAVEIPTTTLVNELSYNTRL
eukprot:GFUD01051844.1.p1 GENE.GFUD01051844.1~~GFUD01051844.1.p1  ORF type:complete len:226 (-),score=59.65 GFUD01051844.1:72-749(-)